MPLSLDTGSWGPSPRIRGECHLHSPTGRAQRTIPANTGRIFMLTPYFDGRWDHPREYGENHSLDPALTLRAGPSPRIRGEWY